MNPDAFVGEIRAFPYSFEPVGWYACSGQFLSIAEDQLLFSIIGTIYGGDGRTTFQLPNFNGASPVSSGRQPGGQLYREGVKWGFTTISLNTSEMPAHRHVLSGASVPGPGLITKLENLPTQSSYVSNVVTKTSDTTGFPGRAYSTDTPDSELAVEAISISGHSAAHNNMQPFQIMRYFICSDGVYPPRP